MKIVSNKHKIELYDSKLFNGYFDDQRIAVFDIETLGLSPMYQPVILIGLMTVDINGNAEVTQYFAETPMDEKLIIQMLDENLDNCDYVLTYNGKHFDIPYIEKRSKILGYDFRNAGIFNLDLYLIINGYSNIKSVTGSLSQKSVEKYMGFSEERADEISGGESVLLYENYLLESDPKKKAFLENKILLHNHDDLLQLYKLLPVLKQCKLHKAFFKTGFPIKGISGWPNLVLKSSKIAMGKLVIEGVTKETIRYSSFPSFDANYYSNFAGNEFTFEIPLIKYKGNLFIKLSEFLDQWDDFSKYPKFVDDYILAKATSENDPSYLELNRFAKELLTKFMGDNISPAAVLY